MLATFRRWLVVVLLVCVAGAATLAQRGYRGPMTKVDYDGRFTFVRMSYDEGLRGVGRGGAHWAHDYPTGEANFLQILATVSNVPARLDATSVMSFDDPDMFRFPVIYLVEPGYWQPDDVQVTALREYLTKGGFLIVDDFPYWAWDHFAAQMSRVFPGGEWRELDDSSPILHTFFDIDSLDVVPAYPALGDRPIFRALFVDNDPAGRMQVIANYQNDLSEYWEYSDWGYYALSETNEAYKVGVNQFVYGITH